MPQRPLSISIIAWLMIVVSALSMIGLVITFVLSSSMPAVQAAMAANPLPPWFQYAINIVFAIVWIAAGVALLRGKAWGRIAFVASSAASFALGLATAPAKLMLIPSLLLCIVVTLFLYRPVASRYLAARAGADA